MFNGAVMVAYEGFVPSIIKLVGLVLLAVLMWRNSSRRLIARPESPPPGPGL
jgi:hypothetical protein